MPVHNTDGPTQRRSRKARMAEQTRPAKPGLPDITRNCANRWARAETCRGARRLGKYQTSGKRTLRK
eukprot:5145071-Lingulodinium_polyedra.AAC.1